MTEGRVERWDEEKYAWVSLRPAWSPAGLLAGLSLGTVGVAGFIVLLLLAPLERGLFFTDARYPFEVLVAMLAALVAVDRAVRGLGPLWDRPMDWAILAYAAGYGLSLAAGPAAANAALDGAFLGVALLLWYWSSAHLFRGEARVRLLAYGVFASGLLLSLLGGLAAMGLFRFPFAVLGNNRILSTLQYPNALAASIIAALCAGFGLVQDALGRKPSRSRQWALAGYAAGITAMTVVLVGTYSRGGWIVFAAVAALWFLGVPRALRLEAGLTLGWALLAGLAMSRAFLEPFHQVGLNLRLGASGEARAMLAAAAVGALGAPAYRQVRRMVLRQRWSTKVRRALAVSAGVYGGLMVLVLALVAHHDAVRSGEGVLGAAFGQRLASIGGAAGATQPRYMFWGDAWRLIRRRPLLGYGGGGWTALYHQVQSAPYAANLVHGSLPQAWVDGGLLAAAGLCALGLLLLRQGWRLRGAAGGPLLWGLAVGGFGLWGHALIDFDLSIPALAFLLWAVAGALRAPEPAAVAEQPLRPAPAPAPAPAPGPAARRMAALGLVAAGACAVPLLLYAQRVGFAARLAAYSAVAIADRQYATAYVTGAQALRLDPLSAANLADQAQLLTAAYSVNAAPGERSQALAEAGRALRLDPGDIDANEAALTVAAELQAWPSVRAWAPEVLARFPLVDSAYQDAGAALLRSAEAELLAGDRAGATADLRILASQPGRYAAAAVRLEGPAAAAKGSPLSDATLAPVGAADLLLGQVAAGQAVLGPLAQRGNSDAAAWLSAEDLRGGDPVLAAALLAGVKDPTAAVTAASAQRLLAAAAG